MGNCGFKGFGGGGVEVDEMVRVVTSKGGVMELYAPITAESITNEFPGHAIYTSPWDPLSSSRPLLRTDHLQVGQLYYLLPLSSNTTPSCSHQRAATNYRMSFDQRRGGGGGGYFSEDQRVVVPRYSGRGVWKVKLVISPEQLGEILAQEDATQELIDSVRTVAKCGTTTYCSSYAASSAGDSDHWSTVSGGWNWKLPGGGSTNSFDDR